MESKDVVVVLKKHNDKDSLVFNIYDDKEIVIDLNDEDQSKLKDLFYAIIQRLTNGMINIVLEKEDGYDTTIFIELATEYIKSLNDEISTVYSNIPKKE